nr:hypothetical protein [Tanacetum cinerariifolium]
GRLRRGRGRFSFGRRLVAPRGCGAGCAARFGALRLAPIPRANQRGGCC